MLLLLYFVLQLQLLNLSSPKTENMKFVSLLSVWRGRKVPLPPPFFFFFLFFKFYLEGEEKEG